MIEVLKNLKILIYGGDRREAELYRFWKTEGIFPVTAGLEKSPLIDKKDIVCPEMPGEYDVVIIPLRGIDEEGRVAAPLSSNASRYLNIAPLLESFKGERLLVLTGNVNERLRSRFPPAVKLIITAEDNELALLNSIPTAEGAIFKALQLGSITIHDSRCLVLGLGRCGTTLAIRLQGLGAKVKAVVRRQEIHALSATLNISGIYFEDLENEIGGADFIFNTVPSLVLPAGLLAHVRKEAIILDLASLPGGVDMEAARSLGLHVHILPGLPGEIAPTTAAMNLKRIYQRLIVSHS